MMATIRAMTTNGADISVMNQSKAMMPTATATMVATNTHRTAMSRFVSDSPGVVAEP